MLWLSQRTERAGAPSPLNATLTTTPAPPTSTSIPGVAAVRAFSDTIEKRVYDPKQVIDRAGFADGMQRLAQRLDTERFRTPPPAASPAGTDAMASLGSPVSLSRLSVATPEGLPLPPEGRSLTLEITAAEKRESVQLTGFPTLVDMVLEEGAMLTMAVFTFEPGGLFSRAKYERWTKVARIAASDIRIRGPLQLKLAGERPLREGAPVESVALELGIRTARFEPSAGTAKSTALRAGPADGVAVHRATPGAPEGWIEQVIIPAAGSKTYALIWRDRRGAGWGAAEAHRTDGGPPIGVVAPGLPLLAAAADGWGSLAIRLANNPRRDGAAFVVAAATGDSGAAEALFLAFAASHVEQLTVDGASLSAAEIARTLGWVRMAFGLSPDLDPAILDRLTPEVAAALRRTLAKGAAR